MKTGWLFILFLFPLFSYSKLSAQNYRESDYLQAWIEQYSNGDSIDFVFVRKFRFIGRKGKICDNDKIRKHISSMVHDTMPELDTLLKNNEFYTHVFNTHDWSGKRITRIIKVVNHLPKYPESFFSVGAPYKLKEDIYVASLCNGYVPTYYIVVLFHWDQAQKKIDVIKGEWMLTSSGMRFR